MPQLQAQVPHPLAQDTPHLLTTSGVTTPSIWVDLLIFIRERWLKGAAMQVQLNDVGCGECLLREVGEEVFVDDARTRHADGFLLFLVLVGWMRCHYDPAGHACGGRWDLWTIVEATHGLAFWALLGLIGRQVQACLN
jgi:hypothetical protein